jgi:5-methylcytosine-specific restriction endonuclease McrA
MGEKAWKDYQVLRNNIKANAWRIRNADSVVNWRVDKKRKLITLLGGKCQECGYDKDYPAVYHFHHKNPGNKNFGISGMTIAFKKLVAEAKKCILLCANCHAEEHSKKYSESRKLTINRMKK